MDEHGIPFCLNGLKNWKKGVAILPLSFITNKQHKAAQQQHICSSNICNSNI